MNPALTKIESKSPVVITATWDGVRHWQNAAKMFEQGKLFSQVMVGFELLALQKQHGIQHGGDRASSQIGNLKPDWETILQKEAGLAQSTAYRYMDMAKAAAPRLKKLPALKNFDPFTTSLAKLGEPQREALTSAVKKLTDGKSQADFFEEFYKQPTGAGATGGTGGNTKKKLTLAEEKALHIEMATMQWKSIEKQLGTYTCQFLVLTDYEIVAQSAVLEQALSARKAWLKQPSNKRDVKAITEMFRQGAGAQS